MPNHHEKVLWSIAFPGFGQLLNKAYVKGFIFIVLEIVINVNAHLNQVIIFSFMGETSKAAHSANYQWLLFYPCVYMFAIWDAYRDASASLPRFAVLPFVGSAYLGTVGVIYSHSLKLFGLLPGPVFLPIAFLVLGFAGGFLLKSLLEKFN